MSPAVLHAGHQGSVARLPEAPEDGKLHCAEHEEREDHHYLTCEFSMLSMSPPIREILRNSLIIFTFFV